jgi:hypothetical protein
MKLNFILSIIFASSSLAAPITIGQIDLSKRAKNGGGNKKLQKKINNQS